jgi:Domain of unknown function (DUF4129)
MRRLSAGSVAGVAAAVFAAVLIVGWGASAGPEAVVHSSPPTSAALPEVPSPSASATPLPMGQGRPSDGPLERHHPIALVVLLIVALAATAALMVGVLGSAAVGMLRAARGGHARSRRQAPEGRPRPAAFDADAMDSLALVMTTELADLERGSVRNAITRCWVAVEQEAARWGVAPEPTDTSTEFALRLLRGLGADAEAAQDLAALFREARFSDHELGEEKRRRAVELMTRVLESAQVSA